MCTPPATLCTPHATLSRWAELLAVKFNEQAEELGLVGLPKISYMTCCYVKTKGSDRPAAEEVKERYLFAERKIEGDFRKWNTNFGATVKTEVEPAELSSTSAAAAAKGAKEGHRVTRLNSDLVPQAFSHFSYEYSRGKKLVCDLQGVWNADDGFVLTDPVVHYVSSSGRRHKNGATDKGEEGASAFSGRTSAVPSAKGWACKSAPMRIS